MRDLKILNRLDNIGVSYKLVSNNTHAVITCPYCDKLKCFINLNKGVWDCKVCGEAGGFKKLWGELTGEMNNVMTLSQPQVQQEPIPDIKLQHLSLLNHSTYKPALEYLASRGIWGHTIEKLQLGAVNDASGLWVTIPYISKDNKCTFVKKRAVPGHNKSEVRYKGLTGREAGLYNEACLKPGLEYVVITEGEFDAISLIEEGGEYVVAVPGASTKKATWVKKLLDTGAKKFILCYDNDEAGNTNASLMANKLGLDKCFRKILPSEFKDLNDYFLSGATLTQFHALPEEQFDVSGVVDLEEVLDELEDQFTNGSKVGKIFTGYPSVDSLTLGFEPGDCVGVLADGKVGKTTWCQNITHRLNKAGWNTFMFCLEMMPVRLVEKQVCLATGTNAGDISVNNIKDLITETKKVYTGFPGTNYFGYTKQVSKEIVFDTIRQAVHRYGIQVVVFDNLQLLARNQEHSVQELSILSAEFKALCMELGIVMFLIIQPHRISEGSVVSARNAMGSSAIEKNVDHMICLHRNRQTITKQSEIVGLPDSTVETFDPYMLVKVDLCRYGPGGQTMLYFDGAKSTVYELNEFEQLGKPPVDKPPFEDYVEV